MEGRKKERKEGRNGRRKDGESVALGSQPRKSVKKDENNMLYGEAEESK